MDGRSYPERWLPFPELVERGPFAEPYSISDSRGLPVPSPGMVNLKHRVMAVPLSAAGRNVARHELAHVAWSPARWPRVSFPMSLLLAVEDARINLGLRAVGLPVGSGRWERGQLAARAAEDVEEGAFGVHLVRSLAGIGTEGQDILREVRQDLPAPARELVDRLVARVEAGLLQGARRVRRPVASFRTARRLAESVAEELRRAGLLHLVPERLPQVQPAAPWPFEEMGRPERVTGARPGVLRIRSVPLVRPWSGPAPRAARRFVASPEGVRLGRIQRWYTDRAVFRRPLGSGGGTVLVDASGSMHFSLEDLDRILDATRGAALVGIYSGRGSRGELRIVARGGRRAAREDLHPPGGGNVVDLPALRWLARQDRPRIWISDGCVTGVNDEFCAELERRCQAVVRRAGIHHVGDAAEAVKVLRRGARRRREPARAAPPPAGRAADRVRPSRRRRRLGGILARLRSRTVFDETPTPAPGGGAPP